MPRFTIRGEIYIDAEKVRQVVKGNKPGPINKYYVKIDSLSRGFVVAGREDKECPSRDSTIN